MRSFITTISIGLALGGISKGTAGHVGIVLNFFPASTYNLNTSVMDSALGITGYTIDDFESTALIPGLTITLTGGVPATTWTALPALYSESACGGLGIAAWDGTHAATNSITNQIDNCATPSGPASLTTFNYAPGTTSFGISLSNFQSLNSPSFPITNHELFVNGIDFGTIETLAGATWSPGITRNAYIRVDGVGGSTITSVGFENLSGVDFLGFDRLAVQGSATTPEPTTLPLTVAACTVALLAARRPRRSIL